MAGQILIQRGAVGAGGGGTPGGANTQVQYNDGGAFGGDAGLTFDETTDALTVGGALSAASATLTGLTTNAFLYSGTSGLLTTTVAPTDGQLLIGSTGAAPVRATLTAGANVTITNGAGSIQIAAAGGGGGTPGGADTQVQYNDGGAFGGDAGLVYNKTTDLLTADHLLLTQGTITDPEPNLEGTVTWSDAADTFTAWKLNVTNTNSAAASMLLDLHVGGVSMFGARRDGTLIFGTNCLIRNDASNLVLGHSDGQFIDCKTTGGTVRYLRFFGGAAGVGQGILFGAAPDTGLFRDASDALGIRNDSVAQKFRVYGTFTTSANYERFAVNTATGTKVTLAAETAGTGADNLDLELLPVGTGVVQISNEVNGAAAATATLTNAPTAGNPSIWLKVKIGANVRYIPAWA